MAELPAHSIPVSAKWVLDICLDFFSAGNPLRIELEKAIGKIDTQVIHNVYELVQYKQVHCSAEAKLACRSGFKECEDECNPI